MGSCWEGVQLLVWSAVLTALVSTASGLGSCQQDFVIHESTIIRTEDSRERGAAFLNVTEVDDNVRCLQACCSRTQCNAAIYEAKSRSCFLFDCGTLDDYRCLFTPHTQFVSSTLKVSRGQLDLTQWGSQSRHAAELTNLRNKPTDQGGETGDSSEKQKSLEKPLKEILQPAATSAPRAATVGRERCTRYQFECHSGECIAIYNACDGIPQCGDGSDEAAELACPPDTASADGPVPTPAVPKSPSAGEASRAAAQHQQQKQQQHPALTPAPQLTAAAAAAAQTNSADTGSGWDPSLFSQGYPDQLPPSGDIFTHRQQNVLNGINHFPAPAGGGPSHLHHSIQPIRYDKVPAGLGVGSGPYQQPMPALYEDLYQPWPARLPAGYPPYDTGGGGVAPLRYDLPLPQRPASVFYPDYQPPGGGPANLWSPGQPQQPGGPPQTGQQAAGSAADKPKPIDRRPDPEKLNRTAAVAPPANGSSGGNSSAAQPPTSAAPPRADNTTSHPSPGTPKPAAHGASTVAPSVTTAASPVIDEIEFSLSELRAQAELQSSERQGAAVVLALGVLLSCALVGMALCRLQCCRQRGRRTDRPGLAHDADYLVNGMYL